MEENEVKPKENGTNTQVYNIIRSDDPSWQSIIYDLINTEQLDPWNIDISLLCTSYFEKIKQLEENNFFLSSKILLAASLLLRIKSEVLLNEYIKGIDEVLFGKKEEEKKILERIEIDEEELPLLSPRTPLPRFKKVTLNELIDALDNAIKTESRRINREIEKKQTERLAYIDVPKFRRINIKDRVRHFYAKILAAFKGKYKEELKVPYSHFAPNKEEKIACFLPMLHLSNNNRLWLEQEGHFTEIWLYLYERFKKEFPDHDSEIEELKQEINEIEESMEDEHLNKAEEINADFENPVGDFLSEEESDKQEI